MAICGVELTGTQWAAIGSFAFAVASEVIGRSKLKQNSVVDVAMTLLGSKVKTLSAAHTPKASERVTPSRPSAASQAKPRRGRPPASKTSSKT